MRSNRLVAAIAICGLLVFTTAAVVALDPVTIMPKNAIMLTNTGSAFVPAGAPLLSDACPATDLGTVSGSLVTAGSTAASADDFDASAWGCGDNAGGPDEIFQFAVDASGFWRISTCDDATFDTSIGLYTDGGGGCPGTFTDCNGDGAGCGGFTSNLEIGLSAGTTYYVVVDGWSSGTYGDFNLTIENISCTSDAECDDGLYCTGVETCNLATGLCEAGTDPCPAPAPACNEVSQICGCASDADCDDLTFCNGVETCDLGTNECVPGAGNPCLDYQTCDEAGAVCVDPLPCISWQTHEIGTSFFPQANNCPQENWTFDDVERSHHTSDILNWYEASFFGRDFAGDAQGTIVLVDLSLWTVEFGSCVPEAQIPDTQCTKAGTILPGGSDPDLLHCDATGTVVLPNNNGDIDRCEIDFFVGSSIATQGYGFGIAGGPRPIGGPGADDDFGQTVFFIEDCPPTGVYSPTGFSPPTINDYGEARVCTAPFGTCCATDGSCSLTIEDDCTAAGGSWGAEVGSFAGGPAACYGDADGDGLDGTCGDNCPDVANAGQEDCNGDGEGDACDPDAGEGDGDGDGVCDGVDNCRFTPNADQADGDGDGVGDVCDPCPLDNPDDTDGDGSCDSNDLCPGFDDNADADGDGVPDGCDLCPGSDDGAAGALDDDDGDGVINCKDLCNGVDDAVFGPECDGAIPTVSEWGLVVLALLLLVAGKVYFGRRENLA